MTKLVIQIRGGVLQHIAADSEIEYVLIDWDNIEAGDAFPTAEETLSEDYFFEDLEAYLEENRP